MASRKLIFLTLFSIGNFLQDVSSQGRKTVTITSIVTEPYLMRKSGNDKRYNGYMADLAVKVAELLDVDYRIQPVKDGRYGALNADGTWSGMIGELIRAEADIAIAPLTITTLRETVVDFSQPILFFGYAMLMKPATGHYIRSFDDLANNPDVKVVFVEGGSTERFLRTSRVPVFERIWTRCDVSSDCGVKTIEEGVKKVRESDTTVMIMESTTAEYLSQRKPCDVMMVGRPKAAAGYGIATPEGSPWTEKVNSAVLTLRQNGVLDKLRKKWWYDLGECGLRSSEATVAQWHKAVVIVCIAVSAIVANAW